MSTGEIIGIGAAVVVVGGGVFWALHKQNAAAAAQSASTAAAAARAAASAKNANDVGGALARLGGRLLGLGADYLTDGLAGFNAKQDAASAVMV